MAYRTGKLMKGEQELPNTKAPVTATTRWANWIYINPSVCRISIMMKKRDCITTSSVTMIRRLGGLRSRIRLG